MCQQDRTQLNVAKAKEFMGRLPAKEVKVQSKVGLFDIERLFTALIFLIFSSSILFTKVHYAGGTVLQFWG